MKSLQTFEAGRARSRLGVGWGDASNGSQTMWHKVGRALRARRNRARAPQAFTLIEVLLAITIAAMALAAINMLLFGALHLRNTTMTVTQNTLPLDRAINTIKDDLAGIMPPGTNQGTMIGVMGTDITGVGMTTPPLLEIFTATGNIQDDVPWGDVQKIDYWLQAPTNRNSETGGKDLVRGITRNLLATIPDAPDPHAVIGGVDDMHFSFYDGTNWNTAWSSTLSNVPLAIKVFLKFATPKSGSPISPPIQFVVPIVMQSSTNSSATNAAN